jgi:hypothetical protein
MYVFLNVFFFVFHSSLIIFILFGWMWAKTRKIHLVTVVLTALSWFFLGIWYWHVRMRLGYYDMPASYLTFLIRSLTGWEVDKTLVDVFAVAGLFLALLASVFTNYRDRRHRKIE